MSIVPKVEATTISKTTVGTLLRIDFSEGPFLGFVVGDTATGINVAVIGLQGEPIFQHVSVSQDLDVWSFGKDWLFEITSFSDRFIDSEVAAKTPGLLTLAPDGSPSLSVVDTSHYNDIKYWDVRKGAPLPQLGHRPLTAASWRLWASAEERLSAVAMPLYDTDDILEIDETNPEAV